MSQTLWATCASQRGRIVEASSRECIAESRLVRLRAGRVLSILARDLEEPLRLAGYRVDRRLDRGEGAWDDIVEGLGRAR